jgi:uncharacterized OsmC-like protein
MSSMTDRDDDDFVLCGGGARPTDVHLASVVHCVNEEIVEWLKRRGTHRAGQMMSVDRGRPEVAGRPSDRRDCPISEVGTRQTYFNRPTQPSSNCRSYR